MTEIAGWELPTESGSVEKGSILGRVNGTPKRKTLVVRAERQGMKFNLTESHISIQVSLATTTSSVTNSTY
jgi:hypothetical protein